MRRRRKQIKHIPILKRIRDDIKRGKKSSIIWTILALMALIGFSCLIYDNYLKPEREKPVTKEGFDELVKLWTEHRGNKESQLDGLPQSSRSVVEILEKALQEEIDNNPAEAILSWEEIIVHHREEITDYGLAISWSSIAFLYMEMCEYEKSYDAAKNAAVIAQKLHDREGRETFCSALSIMGLARMQLGFNQDAILFHNASLEVANRIEDKSLRAVALGNLGIVYLELNEIEKAREYHQKALVLADEINDKFIQAQNLGNLGCVYRNLGELDKAREHLERALKILTVIKDKLGQANVLGSLGNVYFELDELDKAREHLERAIKIATEKENKLLLARGLGSLGVVLAEMKEFEKAVDSYSKSIAIFDEIKNPAGVVSVTWNLALALLELGKISEACAAAQKSLTIAEKYPQFKKNVDYARRFIIENCGE